MVGDYKEIRTASDLNDLDRNELKSLLSKVLQVFDSLEKKINGFERKKEVQKQKHDDLFRRKTIFVYILSFFVFVIALTFITVFTDVFGDEGLFMTIVAVVMGGGTLALLPMAIANIVYNITLNKKMVKNENELKVELDIKQQQLIDGFNDELLQIAGIPVEVIPPKYRLSYVLNMLCEWLNEGRCESWKECIQTFEYELRNEITKQRIEQQHNQLMQQLEAIRFNTTITAIFAARNWR